ncbi:MAG: PaaI family thioesterase, partial [Acidobacteriota bacterium]|nr:PaaI family thioesterase [Acidobacteriota bacterium]
NGGIVATIMDCHSIFTAIADAYVRDERPFASDPLIWYVTGTIAVRYERPMPIDQDVRLIAHATGSSGRKTTVHCKLLSGNDTCATAEVVAIRVADEWKSPT